MEDGQWKLYSEATKTKKESACIMSYLQKAKSEM